jgi:hypothetical protein
MNDVYVQSRFARALKTSKKKYHKSCRRLQVFILN